VLDLGLKNVFYFAGNVKTGYVGGLEAFAKVPFSCKVQEKSAEKLPRI